MLDNGKLVHLIGSPVENGFRAVYGINNVEFNYLISHSSIMNSGNVVFANSNPRATKTYINGGYVVKKNANGFKEILIFNGELEKDAEEEFLLVVIPHAGKIKTKSKKIAGKYPYEAILVMHEGDTLQISKSSSSKVEVFIAVKAGNEMFLIKKSR